MGGEPATEPAIGAVPATTSAARLDWTIVRPLGAPETAERVPKMRTVLLQVGAAALVVVAAVAVVGVLVSRRTAESESVRDAARLTNVLADTVVQPALTDTMATSSSAAARLDPIIRTRVLSDTLVRVKLWTPQGEILYSDEPRLVGRSFDLDDDAREALRHPKVSADISDLDEPENQFEKGRGTLLEVHRPVWTPNGRPLLFEAYYRYNQVSQRATELWRSFAAITLGSIGVLVILLVPLTWGLVLRTRRAQRQRVAMMQRAVEASAEERRRIAATLHDGVVQDLVAASYAIAATAQEAQNRGSTDLAARMRDTAESVRSGVGGMRSLLVDIYPPNLHEAGLASALRDLADGLHIPVELALDESVSAGIDREQTEALFRVVQETLRNVAAHAHASSATVTLYREDGHVVFEIADDGVGFDPAIRPEGHFGLSLLDDTARTNGGELALRTAPGAGTTWRLRLPLDGAR